MKNRLAPVVLWWVCAFVPSASAPVFLYYEFTQLNKPIPDLGEAVDVRSITAPSASILDVNTRLTLAADPGGMFLGDYYATLGHEDALAVLLNRVGRRADNPYGYNDAGLDVQFDDGAASGDVHNYRLELSGNQQTALEGALTGSWAPDGRNVHPLQVSDSSPRTATLSSFNGLDPGGQWRLFLTDISGGGSGRLDSWGLEIKAALEPDQPLIIENAFLKLEDSGQSLANPLELVGDLLFNDWREVTLEGQLRGGGGVRLSGDGRINLRGANLFTGGLNLTEGTVGVGHDSALGTGRIDLNGGAVVPVGGPRVLNNPVTLGGNVQFGGGDSLTFSQRATLTGDRSLAVGNTTVFAGGIEQSEGAFGLKKEGFGTLVLQGQNTYTGPTEVNGGTLRVDGSLLNSSVIIYNGATLGGSGRTGPLTVNSGGMVAPGGSPGTLNTGPETWNGGGAYVWEINQAQGSQGADPGWDWLNINGGLTIAATPENKFKIQITSLTLDNQAGPVADFNNRRVYAWTIATASDGISGFNSAVFNLDASQFVNETGIGYFVLGQAGNNLALNYVPEPGAWKWASSLSLLLLAVLWRMRRRAG